jgi:hypothetical protein
MNDIYEHKAKKYKYKYLKLKNELEGGAIVVTEQIQNKKYYKPFGLYGLHGHIIKDRKNVLNTRKKHINFVKTNKNPKLSNIEINYIHELPIYDDQDVNFKKDNIIIKHLLEYCIEGEYYKDVNDKDIESFRFYEYEYNDPNDKITDKEKYEIQNLIDTSYFTDEINRNKNEEFKIDKEEEKKKEEEEKREKESFEKLKELETKIYEKIIKEHKREVREEEVGEIEQLIEEIKINERKKEEEIEREREREREREKELIKQIKEKKRKEESIRKAREGETEWLSLNKYKKGRHKGLSDYLSRQYVDNFSLASTKILDSSSYIIKKLDENDENGVNKEINENIDKKNKFREDELNLQKERTCINLHSKPTIYEPQDDSEIILLKDELIEKDKKQYLLSDMTLANKLKFNPKISKDSYIYNSANLGYSGYNMMINKATINCIATHHDMIFPIRIILDMDPRTLFYDNIYERTFLKFINDKLKLIFNEEVLNKLLLLVKDNKKIDVRPIDAIPEYNVESEIDEINSKNLDDINLLIYMLIHKKYSDLDKLLNLLLKLLNTDILELKRDIITLFNYIFKIYFNKAYKYLGFWILKFKNNYTDKEIKENDMSHSRPHRSREQYYVFFMFKYIQFETFAPVFKYPIVNFRNNKIESGGVVELKKILYHEILQLLCSYYNNKIFFYIILKKKKTDKDQEKECNLQGEYFTNKKQFFNCTNNWFTSKTEEYFTNKKIYIEDDKIDILISKYNIEDLKKEMDKKKGNELLNINILELGVDNDKKYILLNEEYCLYECYFDYEKSLDKKLREQFVIKLGNLNDKEKDALKNDACIYENDLDRFYFEDMRRTIAAKFNVFNSDEIEKFYNPIKIQDL